MKKLLAALFILTLSFNICAAENEKYYGSTFPATFILYIMSPDIIIGWNGALRGYEMKYIPEKYHSLPVVGGWYGQGTVPDKEVLVREGVKTALVITSGGSTDSSVIKTLKELNISSIVMKGVTMQDYINIFRELGKELDMPERGEALSGYAEEALARVAGMMKGYPEEQRLKVYFAQGADGLETICAGTYRADAITLAGGAVVQNCPVGSKDLVNISFEQLMKYDPDVILIQDPSFMGKYPKDTKWQRLRAVKTGRVYNVPYEPFSWLDRPPSYMRFLGVQWLACKLHPDRCAVDMDGETKKFMKLFFHTDITDKQLSEILLK